MELTKDSQTLMDVFKYGATIFKQHFSNAYFKTLPLLLLGVALITITGYSFSTTMLPLLSQEFSFMGTDGIGVISLLSIGAIMPLMTIIFFVAALKALYQAATQEQSKSLDLYLASIKDTPGLIAQLLILATVTFTIYSFNGLLGAMLEKVNLGGLSSILTATLIIVQVWATIALSQTGIAYIIGDAGIIESLKVSINLVKKNWLYVVLYSIVAAIIMGVFNMIIATPITTVVSNIVSNAPTWLSTPITAFISAVLFSTGTIIFCSLSLSLYFNLKNRQQRQNDEVA